MSKKLTNTDDMDKEIEEIQKKFKLLQEEKKKREGEDQNLKKLLSTLNTLLTIPATATTTIITT
jgi:predicted nuclease with TOPRIM domain